MKPCRTPGCTRPPETNGWCALCAKELEATPTRRPISPPNLPRKKNGQRVWSSQDLLEQIDWMIEDLPSLRGECETVILRACSDSDNGQRGVDYRKPGSKASRSDDGTPASMVLNLALARKADPVAEAMSWLVGDIVHLRALMLDAHRRASFLKGLDIDTAKRLLRKRERSGSGHCENPACGKWCTGGGEDRLKAGRCEACYRYRSSHGGSDRPQALCDALGVTGVPKPLPTATQGRTTGDEYRTVPGVQHVEDPTRVW